MLSMPSLPWQFVCIEFVCLCVCVYVLCYGMSWCPRMHCVFIYGLICLLRISYLFLGALQHKLKSSQKEKVRQFISFTNTGEKTAIYCLSMHDWRMDLATDSYFAHPDRYYKEAKVAVDKKKVTHLFEKYRGIVVFYTLAFLTEIRWRDKSIS